MVDILQTAFSNAFQGKHFDSICAEIVAKDPIKNVSFVVGNVLAKSHFLNQ